MFSGIYGILFATKPMKSITENKRVASPAPRPQSLAWDGRTLWMGSISTNRIYQIDTNNWRVVYETDAPGTPWGMTLAGSALCLISGEDPEDNRYLRRFEKSTGFDPDYRVTCPDFTGSQLGYHDGKIHLSQWYNKVVLQLDESGHPTKTYNSLRGICGQLILDGYIYLANTDDEETNEYFLSRIGITTGTFEDVAKIPFPARALAHDGTQFYTNHRAASEIVAFSI